MSAKYQLGSTLARKVALRPKSSTRTSVPSFRGTLRPSAQRTCISSTSRTPNSAATYSGVPKGGAESTLAEIGVA